jgi:nucleotide-binding universal stress UspA family protein
VLVSRGRRNPAGNVLLIIDREPNSTLVQAAVEEAALRGVGIETLRISHAPVISARPMRRLETTTRNRVQPALPHIIETTAQAQVAVVCTRASGNRGHLPLTSISQTLLNHAACPVLVVPCGNQPASV